MWLLLAGQPAGATGASARGLVTNQLLHANGSGRLKLLSANASFETKSGGLYRLSATEDGNELTPDRRSLDPQAIAKSIRLTF